MIPPRLFAAASLFLLLPFPASASLGPAHARHAREDRIEVTLPPGATLQGRIFGMASGEPVLVEAQGPDRRIGAWTEPDGSYRLADLAPGVWQVTASVAVDPAHPTHQVTAVVEIPDAAADLSLDLAFELGDLTLEGRLAGAPAEPYALRLLPRSRTAPIALALASDTTGRFTFRRLRPGAYRLQVENLAGHEVAEQEVELWTNQVVEVEVATGG